MVEQIIDDVLNHLKHDEINEKAFEASQHAQNQVGRDLILKMLQSDREYKVIQHSSLKDEGFELSAKPFKAAILANIAKIVEVDSLKAFYESQTKET